MTDLAEFLLARISEDEAVATADQIRGSAWADFWGGVVISGGHETVASCKLDDLALVGSEGYTYPANPDDIATAAHIARHDPARVLAECDAKRRIVEDIGVHGAEPLDYSGLALNRVLRLLALPYADHEDYDQSWRP